MSYSLLAGFGLDKPPLTLLMKESASVLNLSHFEAILAFRGPPVFLSGPADQMFTFLINPSLALLCSPEVQEKFSLQKQHSRPKMFQNIAPS